MKVVKPLALLFLFGGLACADTIGPGCSSCLGSAYTLQNLGPGPLPGNDYLIRLIVDTSQFNATDPYNPAVPHITTDVLRAVAINVNVPIIAVAPLVSGPSGYATQLGGTNSGGCSGTGAAFACAQNLINPVTTGGGPYTFVFDVTLKGTQTPDMSTLASHVKAVYYTSGGTFDGQTSANITLQTAAVPEPASLVLLGTVGLFVSLKLRRRVWRSTRSAV